MLYIFDPCKFLTLEENTEATKVTPFSVEGMNGATAEAVSNKIKNRLKKEEMLVWCNYFSVAEGLYTFSNEKLGLLGHFFVDSGAVCILSAPSGIFAKDFDCLMLEEGKHFEYLPQFVISWGGLFREN